MILPQQCIRKRQKPVYQCDHFEKPGDCVGILKKPVDYHSGGFGKLQKPADWCIKFEKPGD
jgi:hypothetical protein